jgi:hypothetical protein
LLIICGKFVIFSLILLISVEPPDKKRSNEIATIGTAASKVTHPLPPPPPLRLYLFPELLRLELLEELWDELLFLDGGIFAP